MLLDALPVLVNETVRLRAWEGRDADLVASVAADPLIPLITTVPAGSPSRDEVQAYLDRQHQRLVDGSGYSFAIAAPDTDEAVGNIGLWTSGIATGRASTGYWIAGRFRRRGRLPARWTIR